MQPRAARTACAVPHGFARRADEAFRKIVQLLEGIDRLDLIFVALAHLCAEIGLEILTDDEDDLAEARVDRIEDGVVQHGLATGAHGIELLEAPVAGAHAGGEKEEGGLHGR